MNKKLLFLILLFVSGWIQALSQDNVEILVKSIEAEFKNIDKQIKTFRELKSDVNDLSSEGGILKKYYEGQILRKATLTLFGETGQSTTEYYFQNGNLIYVKEQVDIYSGPITESKGKTDHIETNKFYFNKEKLLQWINNDNEIVGPDQYPEKANEFLDDVKNIINKQ